MTSERWQQIEDILDQVMPRPPGERKAQLDQLCGEDATLRGEVEEMLIYCDQAQAESFLEKPPVLAAEALDLDSILTEEADADLEAGMMVGPYRIVEPLGSGGMGEVYLAERTDPHMRVALKVVKRGMDTKEILRRFRYEREILARLEHPNIARLHDAGVTDDGRPYFAMEYVEQGQPLDAYCDDHHLSVRARLELFTTVCEAVRYAHRNLVVHRDLKPGNILVSEDEAGQPQVKLLDFGIAKLLEEDAALQTIQMTEAGARRMTPNYAAPEQVIGGPTTTATDVYALGVILYKLLTGRRPYHFDDRSVTGMEQVIRRKIPDRPSTVVVRAARNNGNGSAETTPEHLSLQRAASPKGLRRQLKGDLDAIVLMALRKESERRYASAGEFLDDIQRYLDNHPVVAQHDSVAYRASKFVRRHTAGVSITVAMVVLITALVSIFTARLAAEVDRANQQAARAISTRNFMAGTFELANPGAYVDPSVALDVTFTKRGLIEANLSRIKELSDPLDQAVILDEMGSVYISYVLLDKADSLFSRALTLKMNVLGDPHPDLASSLYGLGQVAHNRNENETADSLYRRALGVLIEAEGDERRLIPDIQNSLAFVLVRLMSLEEAKHWYQEALEEGDALLKEHPGDKKLQLTKAASLRGLARAFWQEGSVEEAEKRNREALAIFNEVSMLTHPEYANSLYGLALILDFNGDALSAEDYYKQALAVYRRVYSGYADEHPTVANTLFSLAMLYHHDLQDFEKADSLYRQTADVYKAIYPSDKPFRAYPLIGRGQLLMDRGDPAKAVFPLREGVAIYERGGLVADLRVVQVKIWLGSCLRELGQYEEAKDYLLQSQASLKDLIYMPDITPNTKTLGRDALQEFVALYEAWKKPDMAAQYQARLDSLQTAMEAQEG